MKHGTAINCIEFTGGNILRVPPAADPNDNNLNLEVKVYKLNPDGSKGELIRIDPAFPEGWDNPRAILPQKPKKEEENIMIPRKDRDEIVATAKKLMTEGKSMTKAAEILKIPLSTLATWLSKDEKQKEPKKNYFGTPIIEPKADKPENGCPFDEPVFNPDMPVERFIVENDKPMPYVPVEPIPESVNYGQAVNQLTLGFIIEIYASDLPPVDKLGLIAKQIKVWEEL